MEKRGVYPKLDKQYILDRLDEEKIMGFYTEVLVCDDHFVGNSFCNPFREDINPTCNYYYSDAGTGGYKLRMRDYSGRSHGNDGREFNADIFDAVALRHKIDMNQKNSFFTILNIIAKDFKIHKYENANEVINFESFLAKQKNHTTKTRVIKVAPRTWNKADDRYWLDKYGITVQNLKHHKVVPADQIWLEDKNGLLNRIYVYSSNDPAYAYYGGKENGIVIWKIYFPFRRHKSQSKVIANKSFMQGFDTFQPAPYGLITKAYKDVMAIKVFGIPTVCLGSESTPPSPDDIFRIKRQCDFVFSLMDFDRAGIRMAIYLRRKYGIEPLMFTRGWYGSVDYGVKDFSDFREAYGHDKTFDIIKSVFEVYTDVLKYSNKLTYNAWQMF